MNCLHFYCYSNGSINHIQVNVFSLRQFFILFFMVHYPALHIFRLKNTYDIQLLFFLERILNYTFKIILMGNVIIRICYDWTRQWHVKIKITSHRWRISKLIKYIFTFWKRFRMGREIVCFILKERKSYTKL